MARPSTRGGAANLRIASTMTASAVMPRTIPFAAAARISARRYPNVLLSDRGRVPRF
jgi:hypothetical protein